VLNGFAVRKVPEISIAHDISWNVEDLVAEKGGGSGEKAQR
jgi:hypothetical protein